MKKSLMLLFLLPFTANAESMLYKVDQLSFQGMSEKKVSQKTRQYLKFRNAQGSHILIYEQDDSLNPVREIASLKQVMAAPQMVCSLEMECSAKAFCTAGCRNMYYEFTNSAFPAGDPKEPRNFCRIRSFDCSLPAAAAAPGRSS